MNTCKDYRQMFLSNNRPRNLSAETSEFCTYTKENKSRAITAQLYKNN